MKKELTKAEKKAWLDRVHIRKMRESDLPLIEWNGAYTRYRRVYREIFQNQERGITTVLIADSREDGVIGQIFLTQKDPNPNFSPEEPYLFISSFRIKEDFRNRGLGTLLLKMAELYAERKHLSLLILNCAKTNQDGLSFYKRHGFEGYRMDDGRWTYIDHQGVIQEEVEPAISMRKRI